jgi:hypothetical protein
MAEVRLLLQRSQGPRVIVVQPRRREATPREIAEELRATVDPDDLADVARLIQ